MGAPGVGAGAARFHVAVVLCRAVAGDLVVEAVHMQAGGHVQGVLELDVDGVSLVHLDQRARDRRPALLEAVAEPPVGELLGVEPEVSHLAADGGRGGVGAGAGGLGRHQR
jgi:hypothetical protein